MLNLDVVADMKWFRLSNGLGGEVNPTMYLQTLRHLRREQVYGMLLSIYPRAVSRQGLCTSLRTPTGKWISPVEPPPIQTGPASFRLAAGEHDINDSDGWSDPEASKLWLYNLHYFDDLIAEGSDERRNWHVELVHRWIHENPPGEGVGWDPYPTACRISNWVKWFLRSGELDSEMTASLALQVRHLRHNLEWRLMANHLFADLKALILGGCFFAGKEADEWLSYGLKVLDEQIREQILTDGGYCELSPMYHTIVLNDMLDLINAAHAFPDCIPAACLPRWIAKSNAMFDWLANMCHPDGRTSFFSDGGFTSYEPAALWDYARRMGIDAPAGTTAGLRHLKESGYIRLENSAATVIFDVGEVGLQYQPGHGHADALSFELSHNGKRILVNSGTSTYTESPERVWQRGTAAHNTVEVDGQDQSELWRAFRIARRSHPIDVRAFQRGDGLVAEAAHTGYRRLRPGVIHGRSLELTPASLKIHDVLDGRGKHDVAVWFHMHPSVRMRVADDRIVLDSPAGRSAIRLDPKLTPAIEATTFNPRFAVSVNNFSLRGAWSGDCPVSFTTEIEFNDR